jgi:hypothetical protein
MLKKGMYALSILAFVIILLAGVVQPAQAQDYFFRLDRETVHVFMNDDGTISIEYFMDFTNPPGSPAIEFIDLGLPTNSYDINSVEADVAGVPITDIQPGDPQFIEGGRGITLGLGPNSIQPGQSASMYVFIGRVEKVFFPGEDPSRPDYASFQFSPNYFGSQYVEGSTDITVALHLPPGVMPEEAVYYPPSSSWPGNDTPESYMDDSGRIVYEWRAPDASAAEEYIFGAGFPASYIPAAAIVKPPAITVDTDTLCCIGFAVLFVGIFALAIYASVFGARKRKLQYLPPKISIEGHGIKRGLTPIEAGILMEQPMDKILTMILFAAVKKGVATVLKRDPLEIQVAQPLPADLQPYETEFLTAFGEQKAGPERRKTLQDMMIGLVKSVSEKMKGFSRKETVQYYTSIMEEAWRQVEAAGTPEVKGEKFGETMEWTMLDRRFDDRTRETFRTGPVFVPMWWPRYDPVFRSSNPTFRPASTTPSTPSGGKTTINLPNLPGSDFAASVVGGVQSFAGGVIGDLTAFTSGVTDKTNPVPKTTYTSSRTRGGSGGGRSCACACACACAGCACACAGGGR